MATADPISNPASGAGAPGAPGPAGPVAEADIADDALNMAAAALGVSADQLYFTIHIIGRYGAQSLTPIQIGAGYTSPQLQALRLHSGGNGAYLLTTGYGALAPTMLPAGAAKKIWLGGYFSTPATIAAGQSVGIGAIDPYGVESLIIGARGDSSTANFVAWADTGGTHNSGIPIDGAKHLHTWHRNGTTGVLAIDGAPLGTVNIRPAANCNPLVVVRSGAAAITGDFSWFAAAAVRE